LKSFRTIQTVLAVVAFSTVLGAGAFASPPAPGVIAVVNRADWCSVCKANHARAGKALGEAAADGSVKILINDITNEDTAKQSAAGLKAAGLDKAMAPYLASGVINGLRSRKKEHLQVAHTLASKLRSLAPQYCWRLLEGRMGQLRQRWPVRWTVL